MADIITSLPKAELHVHVEGTLEPEVMFALADRNGITLPFATAEAVRAAYEFTDLQSFLDLVYQGAAVLHTVEDFDGLMSAYLQRAHADGVRRAEIFFDPQVHTERGIGFEVFMDGFARARRRAAAELGITTALIMCFLRHLPESAALDTLEAAGPYLDQIVAVGLDSSEVGHPPSKFQRVFARAREAGLRAVAHAGEEAPPQYVWEALDLLGAERIDHGVRAEGDAALVSRLAADRIPLTMCPLSNVRLRVIDRIQDHNLKRLLDRGVMVTVNSDDPAYFGGYIGDNYRAAQAGLGLSDAEIRTLARNSIGASFADSAEKARLLA
ncbi:MAG TPA: adenosine deaminase [Candidatus Limnocylindrales bacterium]|nr:adenosine deaminase [Candidatus Limnocylindrales bacterium]